MESRVEDENGKLKVAICEYTKKKSPVGDRYFPLSDYEIEVKSANDIRRTVASEMRRKKWKLKTFNGILATMMKVPLVPTY